MQRELPFRFCSSSKVRNIRFGTKDKDAPVLASHYIAFPDVAMMWQHNALQAAIDSGFTQTGRPTMIFKICSKAIWENAVQQRVFAGAGIDLQDGYIHFSTSKQIRETAARHFAGQNDLLLIAVDEAILGDDLKWEVSRGGDLFPHLYKALQVANVNGVYPLMLNEQGVHEFPDLPKAN